MDTGQTVEMSMPGTVKKSMCRLVLQDVRRIFLTCLKDVLPSSVAHFTLKLTLTQALMGSGVFTTWWELLRTPPPPFTTWGGGGRTLLPHFHSVSLPDGLSEKREKRSKDRQKSWWKLSVNLSIRLALRLLEVIKKSNLTKCHIYLEMCHYLRNYYR